MSEDVVRRARLELRHHITSTLVVLPVVHDVIPLLSQQVLADVAKLESADVHITIGESFISGCQFIFMSRFRL